MDDRSHRRRDARGRRHGASTGRRCCRRGDPEGGRRHARPEHSRSTHQLLQMDDQQGQHRQDRDAECEARWRLLRMDGRRTHDAQPGLSGLLQLELHLGPGDERAGGRPGHRGRPQPRGTDHPGSGPVPDLRARGRVQARRHAVHGPGRWPGRRPAPAVADADGHGQGAGVRRRDRDERPVRPGRGWPVELLGQDRRLPGPGQHGRVRQPVVHEVRLQRPEQRRRPGPGRGDSPRRQPGADDDPPGRQVPVRRYQHGRRRQQRRYPAVCRQGPRRHGRARRADDPQPGPEPVRAVARSADRLELDPDHHARGQPRLGFLGDGGCDGLRHRVRHRR